MNYEDYYKLKVLKFIHEINVKKNTFKELIGSIGYPLENIKVLDIGFGSGEILFCFNQTNELNGVDLSYNAVKRSVKRAKKEGYKHFKFLRLDISKSKMLPFSPRYFDTIICSHVIEHVNNDVSILQEIKRLIKPNGKIVIGIPINEKLDNPKHYRKYNTDSFVLKLKKLGLETKSIIENNSINRFFDIISKTEGIPALRYALSAILNVAFSITPWSVLSKLDRQLIKKGVLPEHAFLVVEKIDKKQNHLNQTKIHFCDNSFNKGGEGLLK